MRRTVVAISIFAIVCACAKEKPVIVARVGSLEVTMDELQKRVGTREFSDEAQELKIKKGALESIVENKLLVLEGKDRGYEKEEEFAKKVEEWTKDAAIRHMYTKLIVEQVTVTDEEVKEAWNRLGQELRVRIIVSDTREEAEGILEELKAGGQFAKIAEERSVHKSTAAKGGDTGYIKWDNYGPELGEVLLALSPGEISDVVEMRGQYYIAKLEDRRTVVQRAFQDEEERLREQVTMMKRGKLAEDFVNELKEKANVVIDEDVLSWVEERAQAEAAERRGGVPQLTPEEKDKVLVTFHGEKWTLGETLERFGPAPPRLTDKATLQRSIEGLVIGELLWLEAKRRGLHRAEEVEQSVSERTEMDLAGRVKQEIVQNIEQPTEEEMLKFYDSNKDKFEDQDFEKAKRSIRVQLLTERRREMQEKMIEELKQKHHIEIYEENLLAKGDSGEQEKPEEEPEGLP
ncbi:hypothetical protein AMJ40_02910 [candidate division TA06 bacterium DG_26]|uniref:PpiC domain-containing protein n=1 Tax=candidate division TA06 bacterium DG_26 TaxID=1703771 RepID=A0A0S7WJY3_UNCT6|nr:MAG: hypothetical protein AMJ40_02910 [candidate division TA06 bacterium DG_26]